MVTSTPFMVRVPANGGLKVRPVVAPHPGLLALMWATMPVSGVPLGGKIVMAKPSVVFASGIGFCSE